jgi:estrogen-related receptor beta like 1
VKVKAALTKLRLEIKTMDLRIGVLSHTVLQQTFMEKKWTHEKENYNQNGLIFEENDELSD